MFQILFLFFYIYFLVVVFFVVVVLVVFVVFVMVVFVVVIFVPNQIFEELPRLTYKSWSVLRP